jgi:TonB family protein
MKLVTFLLFSSFVFGQTTTPSPDLKAQSAASSADQKNQSRAFGLGIDASGRHTGVIDILSDTRGVDFGPYLNQSMDAVRENWYHLIPKCAEMMKGRLAIEFAIQRDGCIVDMRLVATSGETVLDRAAWGSITAANPFPALPEEFKGPHLALRFRFQYNPDGRDSPDKKCDDYPLEVASPAETESGVALLISAPDGTRVPLGASRPVKAVVTGSGRKENGVEWRISGVGCSVAACGEMTKDAYRAPSVMPSPPYVTLPAVSKADPSAKVSITLHIVDSHPSHE